MKSFVAALVLVCAVVSLSDAADIVIPSPGKATEVKLGETVRISASGIAGSRITIKVEGAGAGNVTENQVVRRRGAQNLIGSIVKEVEFKPTGKGTIKATATVTPPQPNTKAAVTEYDIEVK